MKKQFFIPMFLLAALFFTACNSEGNGEVTDENNTSTEVSSNVNETETNTEKPDYPKTQVEFMEKTHNFGKIKQGEKVAYTFKFKNTGENPLYVENVKPSCGCTASDYTKDPVPPGGEGYIKLEFDSNGKSGVTNKSATVTMNTEVNPHILTFEAEILE